MKKSKFENESCRRCSDGAFKTAKNRCLVTFCNVYCFITTVGGQNSKVTERLYFTILRGIP